MGKPVHAATSAPPWRSLLAGLRGEELDCIQTSISLIADRCYGAGSHLALGARTGLALVPAGASLQPTVADRLTEAADLLGLAVTARWTGVTGSAIAAIAAGCGLLLVVSDAYYLPWLPYAGREHMEHSYLLASTGDGGFVAVDGYHNDTAWGPARPGCLVLPADRLSSIVQRGADAVTMAPGSLPALDVRATLAANARLADQAAAAVDQFLAAARRRVGTAPGISGLVLDIWLVTRARLLHASWLAAAGLPEASSAVGERAREWQVLAAQSYVALRRAQRGRRPAPALVTQLAKLIHDDRLLAARIAGMSGSAPAGNGTDLVRAAVLGALRDALALDEDAILASGALRDLPGFNSFRLLDVIERTEGRLGVEFPPDQIGTAYVSDAMALCAMFTAARAAGRREQPWPR